MSEKDVEKPLKKVKWFSELVENLPKPRGESFSDKVVDIESAKLVRAAGEVAMDSVHGKPAKGGVEKGINEALEDVGKQIITEKLVGKDPIRQKVDEAIGNLVGQAITEKFRGGGSEAEKELAAIREKERLEAMFNSFTEKVVSPLVEEVQALKESVAGKSEGAKMTTDKAVEMVMDAQERYKKFLENQGYSVESVHVTKEDVKKMLEEETAKFDTLLAEEKEKWEKESGAAVEIEKERIRATEQILTGVTDRVFDIFLEPIKEKIQEAIEKGAFRRPPAEA